ncbi:hypothetical protein BDB01DRAFT_794651 [Pilobolus umbonatus]|nr:hypothetical protein BDB01DRAFT_794651 [Pilobolus umbonatus]
MSSITTERTRPSRPTDNSEPQDDEEVVEVIITASGTNIYTQTEISYSYIPSYSTIIQTRPPPSNNTNGESNGNNSNDGNTNIGPIIGGVIGAIVLVCLIGTAFFLRRRNRNKQNVSKLDKYTTDDLPYTAGGIPLQDTPPAPRRFVAPLQDKGEEPTQYQVPNGYYYNNDEISHNIYTSRNYSADISLSDSVPSTSVDVPAYPSFRHVPNEIDHPHERHVPHLKD